MTSSSGGSPAFAAMGGVGSSLFSLVFAVLMIAGMWMIYVKAGRPGWAAIIPFYNTWVLMEIAGKPGWWFFLLLIPIVNVVIWVIVAIELSKKFGHGIPFALGLMFLPFIFYLILGFGSDQYRG
jgi:hypothetical protein